MEGDLNRQKFELSRRKGEKKSVRVAKRNTGIRRARRVVTICGSDDEVRSDRRI